MNENNVPQQDPAAEPEGDLSLGPRVFDFSSDFTISQVKEDAATVSSGDVSRPAPAPAPVSVPPPVPPASPVPPTPPTPAPAPRPAPAPAPIPPAAPSSASQMDTGKEWPFSFTKPTDAAQTPAPATLRPTPPPVMPAPQFQQPPRPVEQPRPVVPSRPVPPPPRVFQAPLGQGSEIPHPATNLQRDVSAILPNLKRPQATNVPADPLAAAKASQDPNLKPLRTYEGDVAEALAHRQTSTASIAIAEGKRQTGDDRLVASGPPVQAHAGRHAVGKILIVLVSLILIGAGGFGGYYLYTHSALFTAQQSTATTPSQPAIKSLVPADKQVFIATDSLAPAAVAVRIKAEAALPQQPGELKEIVLTRSSAAGTVQVPLPDAIHMLNIPAPDLAVRTLSAPWMLGVYTSLSGEKSAFVLAKTDFFQNAFAGMLQWEASMPNDLAPYLTATSTIIRGGFTDRIIKNKDVRTFVADGAGPLLSYSFLDNSTLVIAGSESAISELVVRLENQAFVR